ncbi:hypothetical protein FA13DRAFT_1729710 [Coprinellus micaceus]|uniref:Uncharacterized protein n=1 Tax=Coprinellus micaceus TaxID=71717 RepID=A0A4Y7TL20_COPMI|nr:hypothetical protein FA13DRAFT_1729710 [Coprinellus micaceus]
MGPSRPIVAPRRHHNPPELGGHQDGSPGLVDGEYPPGVNGKKGLGNSTKLMWRFDKVI